MIHYYGWDTSNSRKATILLEELGVSYQYIPVNLRQKEQRSDWFLQLNRNGKIPVLIDDQGLDGSPVTLSESGAILIYLAERYASPLLPSAPQARARTMQWLMFQMAGLGPMAGQALHFYKDSEEIHPYSLERFMGETEHLYRVMDDHLGEHQFFSGDYSIADIAIYPWIARHEWLDIELANYPHLRRWFLALSERPQIQRGMAALGPQQGISAHTRLQIRPRMAAI